MGIRERIEAAKAATDSTPVSTALASWDGTFTDEAIARVLEVMAKDFKYDRKDGSGRLRPSSLKHPCDRVKLFSFHGENNDSENRDLERISAIGTFSHYWWQLAGLSAGIFTDIETPFSYEPWMTAGSADAVLSSGIPFELKTMTWQKFRDSAGRRSIDGLPAPVMFDEHLPQIYAAMASFNSRSISVIYQERNTARFHEFLYEWDDSVVAGIDTMMRGLVSYVENSTFPPILHGCLKQRGNVYSDCGYKEACFREG